MYFCHIRFVHSQNKHLLALRHTLGRSSSASLQLWHVPMTCVIRVSFLAVSSNFIRRLDSSLSVMASELPIQQVVDVDEQLEEASLLVCMLH